MKFSITFLFVLCFQQGISQFIACEWSWAETYTISAKSGLKLRKGQRVASKMIALIPFQHEIKVCYENTKPETIDGIQGKWVKVFWEEKEGYVFDAYIEPKKEDFSIALYNAEMDLINVWHQTSFSSDQEPWGLFGIPNEQDFQLRKVKLAKVENTDLHKPAEDEEIPIWIFSKWETTQGRTIKGKEINRMIFLGEKVNVNHGTIYGDGILNKEDSIKVEGFTINPYELRFQYREGDQIHDQLLLKMKCMGGMSETYGYEAKAVVNFIGDLDGDTQDDILITFQTTYKGWNYGLFSTRYASKGKRFKEMIVGYGSE